MGGLQELESTDHSLEEPASIVTRRNMRWNFGALTVDVSFFSLGMAFLDLSAVIPLLLVRLGGGPLVVGLFAAVHFFVFSAPQMFIAWAMLGRPRQKPVLCAVAALTRLPLLALPWFLWHAGDSAASRQAALVATFVLLTIWTFGDGLGYVPWMEIVAREFTSRVRGRFFATTQLISGAATILIAAGIVRTVLNGRVFAFPHNYAVLAGLSALMFHISLAGVLLIRESRVPHLDTEARIEPREYMRRLPILVRDNPAFGRLALVQLLVGFGSAASPFYVLYATQRFHLPDYWGGNYQVMLAISVVALTPVWALLSEKKDPSVSVRALALVCATTPLLALTVGRFSPWAFGLVFLSMGGSLGWGMWLVFNHYLLTHVPEPERPIYVALLNLLFLPSAIYPFLGGLMVPHNQFAAFHGAPFVFLVTLLVTLAGLGFSLRLPHAPDRAISEQSVRA